MTIALQGPLVLAGAGRMGGALLKGLIERGLAPKSVIIQEPSPAREIAEFAAAHAIAITPAARNLYKPPSVIIVAVKPQAMEQVFPALAKLAGPDTLTLSIAAGRSVASYEKDLPKGAAVVRAMPNTPAAIGRGITVGFANGNVTAEQKALVDELLSAVGEVGWVEDEALMDAVTAVSGSGPAYVFLLAEYLAEAGVTAGLDPALAMRLARATVAGSGELLHRSSDDPATLRQNVTSPGGTTAAALNVLMAEEGLKPLLQRAVAKAVSRGRELAK